MSEANRNSTSSPSQNTGIETKTQRDAHRAAVENGAALDRGDDPDRDPQEDPQHDRADGQRDRCRQPVLDQAEHGCPAVVAVAEVEVQDDALHVDARTGCRPACRDPARAGCRAIWSTGSQLRPARSTAGSAEGNTLNRMNVSSADQEQQHDAPQNPADDVCAHSLSRCSARTRAAVDPAASGPRAGAPATSAT